MPSVTVAVLVALVAATLAVSPLVLRRLARRRLRARFGAEYDHTVRSFHGDVAGAEGELAERVALHRRLHLTAPTPAERLAVQERLRRIQAEFVDDPVQAAADADRLLQSLLDRVGYPGPGRVPALSVDHADLMAGYRTALDTVERSRAGQAGAEELREALLAVRALVHAVLEHDPGTASAHAAVVKRPAPVRHAPTAHRA